MIAKNRERIIIICALSYLIFFYGLLSEINLDDGDGSSKREENGQYSQ